MLVDREQSTSIEPVGWRPRPPRGGRPARVAGGARSRTAVCSRRSSSPRRSSSCVLVVGRSVRLGDLPQHDRRHRRLAQRELGRLRQLHERVVGRPLPEGAPQHADLHVRLAGRRAWSARRSSPTTSSATSAGSGSSGSSIILPWAAPVVLSTISWLWILDSLFSVINWTLARLHIDNALVWLLDVATSRRAPSPPQWLGPPEPRAHRHHTRPRLAHPALRGHHLHRRPCLDPDRGRRCVQDRRRDGHQEAAGTSTLPLQLPIALVAVLFGIVFTAGDFAVVYILTAGRAVQLDAGAAPPGRSQVGINSGSLGRRSRDLALPLPAARRRERRDALLREKGPGLSDRAHDDRAPQGLTDVPRAGAVRDPARVPLLLRARDDVQGGPRPLERRELALRLHDPEGNLGWDFWKSRQRSTSRSSSQDTNYCDVDRSTRRSWAWPWSRSRSSSALPAGLCPRAARRRLGPDRGRRHLPRLPDSAHAPLPPALADRHSAST